MPLPHSESSYYKAEKAELLWRLLLPVGAHGETLSLGGFPDLRKVLNPKGVRPASGWWLVVNS